MEGGSEWEHTHTGTTQDQTGRAQGTHGGTDAVLKEQLDFLTNAHTLPAQQLRCLTSIMVCLPEGQFVFEHDKI